MSRQFSKEQQNRCQSYLKMHLSKDERELPTAEQIPIVEKKNRKRWWYMGLNVAFILLIGYSFWSGLTQLSSTIFYILIIVFFINIALFMYQRKQLHELSAYLQWKEKS